MAKKRGKRGSRRRAPEPAKRHDLPSGFWSQILAVGFIIFSILIIGGALGADGTALVAIQQYGDVLFGRALILLPAVLVFLAVKIFSSEDNRLAPSIWIASGLMVCWLSGLLDIGRYNTVDESLLGGALNSVFLSLGYFAGLTYVALIAVTVLFMYAETPAELVRRIKSMFKGGDEAEAKREVKMTRRSARLTAEEVEAVRDLKVNYSNGDQEDEEEEKAKKEKPAKRGLFARNTSAEKVESAEVKAAAPKPVEEKKSALVEMSDPDWKMPPLSLLDRKKAAAVAGDVSAKAEIIRSTLHSFGIDVVVENANIGPRITQFTLIPPQGVEISKISSRDKELALNLAEEKIRIEAPIPGTSYVGIEIPNERPESVNLHSLLHSDEWRSISHTKPLAFIVGKDISGNTVVGNLAKMPHLLVAGTTGSGKSVMTNTLITSMLYHNSPSDLKLIIVDPKQVEMASYQDIPHLLAPIITSVDKALSALKWSVGEMEKRYSLMAEERVKTIDDYNAKMAQKAAEAKPAKVVKEAEKPADEEPSEENVLEAGEAEAESAAEAEEQPAVGSKMPYIVIIVDEMADLMMQAGKELENYIVRIAQKGRAAGLHLVLATQRPEVKVVTGLIKANIPGRIGFAVTTNTDSRVMLDQVGAEKLLGAGDMLYLTTEMMGKPKRVQGAYVSDKEIERITDFLRKQAPANYDENVLNQSVGMGGGPGGGGVFGGGSESDDLNRRAVEIGIANKCTISTSLLQRKLGVGFGKASKVIDELEELGIVGEKQNGSKPRELYVSSIEEYDAKIGS